MDDITKATHVKRLDEFVQEGCAAQNSAAAKAVHPSDYDMIRYDRRV